MPSNFNPLVPTGLLNLDVDYKNLQKNNQQLDTTFGIDHTTFSNNTNQNGYHTSIHQIPVSNPTTNPPNNQPINGYTATAGYGQVLQATINDLINTDQALFFLSGGNLLTQLTRNMPITSGATTGATFLPGGFILNYGNGTFSSGTKITYTQAYPTRSLIVIVSQLNVTSAGAIREVASFAEMPDSFKARITTTGSTPSDSSALICYLSIGI